MMATIKVADFYYGSVISMLLNNGIKPVLIEGNDDRQIYDFTTNQVSSRLFVKYRADKQPTTTENYNSWMFSFTQSDLDELHQFIDVGIKLVLALVCGSKNLSDSELALLDNDDVKQILDKGKSSITISRCKGERKYRISVGGGRSKSMRINCNRLQDLFL